jgi:hypothetical protein
VSRTTAVYICNTVPLHPFIQNANDPDDRECRFCTLPRDEPEHEGQGEQMSIEEETTP